jgi:hypothetical protein
MGKGCDPNLGKRQNVKQWINLLIAGEIGLILILRKVFCLEAGNSRKVQDRVCSLY